MNIFILVPSLSPASPVKGAIALANALVAKRKVVLVVLKSGSGVHAHIDANIKIIYLYEVNGWFKRLRVYKQYLNNAGGKENVASISSCFSADFFNLWCRSSAVICSSIRGNLPLNYRLDYGRKGSLLAIFHLYMVRGFHHVVAMTNSMSLQVANYLGRSPSIIGNFVDEIALEKFRRQSQNKGMFKFVFVGSLTERKMPLLLVNAIESLRRQNYDVALDIIGDGPLFKQIDNEIVKRRLRDVMQLHGHLNEPFNIVASSDVFVLPSSSEGVSRACLEALYLGLPVVLRDVDGNSELIDIGVNGFLFSDDYELSRVMLSAVELSRKKQDAVVSLLPSIYRQSFAAQAYLDLVEKKL